MVSRPFVNDYMSTYLAYLRGTLELALPNNPYVSPKLAASGRFLAWFLVGCGSAAGQSEAILMLLNCVQLTTRFLVHNDARPSASTMMISIGSSRVKCLQ